MINIMRLFKREYELYLDPTYEFDARVPPSGFLSEISPQKHKSQLAKFMKAVSKPTRNEMKVIRILSTLHLLLIYSNEYYSIVAKLIPLQHQCTDQWLIKTIIDPYTHFLQKCCCSRQLFCKSKQVFLTEISFQRLFYLTNLLFQLFKPIKKMSMLGRYYKDCNEVLTTSFVQVIAVQAQKIYGSFKNIIAQMLFVPSKYINTKQKQQLLKSILADSLIQINEQMKKLFLDKYFYPYGKGIGIRLFRIEDQSQQCTKIIQGILNDHQQTARRLEQQQLESSLFPKEGMFNIKFYEQSLMQAHVKNIKQDHLYEQTIDQNEQFDIPSPQPNCNEFKFNIQGKQHSAYQNNSRWGKLIRKEKQEALQ